MSIMGFLHKNKLEICALLVASGIPLTILSILAIFYSDEPGLGNSMYEIFGNWSYWVMVLGGTMVIIGTYTVLNFLKLLREFKGLIDTPSKAKFIKNQDRIEELAWKLHPRYERRVIEKKEKLHIK